MNVKCIGQLLTCWLENAPRKDVEQLCQALQACLTGDQPTGLTQVHHDDTNTVALAGQGTTENPLTANVKVSADTGNGLVLRPDGLYVKPGEGGGDSLPPISMPDDEDADLAVGPDGEPYWRRPTPCRVQTTSAARPTDEDNGKLHTGGGTITLSQDLPVGWRMDIKGAAVIEADPGVIVRSMEGARNVILNGGATLIKISPSTFWLAGAIE